MTTQGKVTVDLSRVRQNVAAFNAISLARPAAGLPAPRKICAVVKSNAYGVGLREIAQAIASQVEILAVADIAEALDLLEATSVAAPLLVLKRDVEPASLRGAIRALQSGRVQLTIHDEDQFRELLEFAQVERLSHLVVQLEVNTGMNRGGVAFSDAAVLLRAIAAAPQVVLAGIFTHFAAPLAEREFTDEQHWKLDQIWREGKDEGIIPETCIRHEASTLAALSNGDYWQSCPRIGLGIYGYGISSVSEQQATPLEMNLAPAIAWSSKLRQCVRVSKGSRVGYGCSWTAPHDCLIGTVPVGYSHGFLSSQYGARLKPYFVDVAMPGDPGCRVPCEVIGVVSLDEFQVDLSPLHVRDSLPLEVLRNLHVDLISTAPGSESTLESMAAYLGVARQEILAGLPSSKDYLSL